jgi:uncharacterized membrane protein (UPF0127 family)
MNRWGRLTEILGQRIAARRAAVSSLLRAENSTRGTVLAERLKAALTSTARRHGLLGRASLQPGEGLWIAPCESVHTFFMHFPIDLVYLDRKGCVRKLRQAVAPWRISMCITAHSVLELPAGTIRATGTERGDRVAIVPAAGNE